MWTNKMGDKTRKLWWQKRNVEQTYSHSAKIERIRDVKKNLVIQINQVLHTLFQCTRHWQNNCSVIYVAINNSMLSRPKPSKSNISCLLLSTLEDINDCNAWHVCTCLGCLDQFSTRLACWLAARLAGIHRFQTDMPRQCTYCTQSIRCHLVTYT